MQFETFDEEEELFPKQQQEAIERPLYKNIIFKKTRGDSEALQLMMEKYREILRRSLDEVKKHETTLAFEKVAQCRHASPRRRPAGQDRSEEHRAVPPRVHQTRRAGQRSRSALHEAEDVREGLRSPRELLQTRQGPALHLLGVLPRHPQQPRLSVEVHRQKAQSTALPAQSRQHPPAEPRRLPRHHLPQPLRALLAAQRVLSAHPAKRTRSSAHKKPSTTARKSC